MDETMKNAATEEFNEQETLMEEDVVTTEEEPESDPLKKAIEEQMRKLQRQNLLIGAQTVCRVVLEKIVTAEAKPGKRTMNDYKRLIKDIRKFCEVGLSRKVNADGETEPAEEESVAEETVQN